jgi:hypothetical protein
MVSNKHEEVFLLLTPPLGKFLFWGLKCTLQSTLSLPRSNFPNHSLLSKLYKIVKLSFIMEIGQGLRMPSCAGTIKLTLTSEHMDFGISCSYSHLVQSSNVKMTYLDTYTSWHRLVFEHYVQLFLLSQT